MGWGGCRTFLALSANPDILRMVIGRLRMRIARGTATFAVSKVKSHRGEPLNEAVDDLADPRVHIKLFLGIDSFDYWLLGLDYQSI